MNIDRIAPELRAPLRRIPPIPLHRPWARRLVRAAGAPGRRVRVAGVDLERPAPGLRVHRPRGATTGAALLWIHGGGARDRRRRHGLPARTRAPPPRRARRLPRRAAALGTEPGAVSVPAYAAPGRRDDLSGLPPAWIGVGDVDLFHDEDLDHARRLHEAGVPVETVVVPGAPHGFEAWAPDSALARDYLAGARSWLAAVLRD